MLVPAVLYKEQIAKNSKSIFIQQICCIKQVVTVTGCLKLRITLKIGNSSMRQQTKNQKLIGYLGYVIDWYISKAYNFGLFSFDRGNLQVPKDVFDKLEELVSTLHRVEWRAVGGNPACRGYDNFIKKHNGTKHILKDSIKDRAGNYHDDIIYEIVHNEGEQICQ